MKDRFNFSYPNATGYFLQIGGGLSFSLLEKYFNIIANLGINVQCSITNIYL
jgi:hypothetical protein